jgi:methyl-accepting chemotaxis protein
MEVKKSSGVLKYTIDNRMIAMQKLRTVNDAFGAAGETSRAAADKSMPAQSAVATIKEQMGIAHSEWDEYFLSAMTPEVQALSDKTTPAVDEAYGVIDKLVAKLGRGELSGLEDWRLSTVRPAIAAVQGNLNELMKLQVAAARQDQEAANKSYETTRRNILALLLAGTALALAVAYWIIRSAMGKLGADPAEVNRVARRIAEGDYRFEMAAAKGDEHSLLGALRQMKESLLRSKLDYEGQISAISKAQSVAEYRTDGTILEANENFLNMVGYALDDVKGKHHTMFLDEAERSVPGYRTFWDRMSRGEFSAGQYRRVKRDGSEIWIQATYNPILDVNGVPFKVVEYATEITRAKQEAQLNAAFKGALDNLAANVMVAGNDGKFIYANSTASTMMNAAQSDFRRDLPAFDASRLVGASMDAFYVGQAGHRDDLAKVTDTHRAELSIGGHKMILVANPMKDDSGRRFGTVVEWFDRTQEAATEDELQNVISSVAAGNFEHRISLQSKSGFFAVLSDGINNLVENVAAVVQQVQELVSAANEGDLTKRIDTEGKAGLLVAIGGGINQLTDNMASVISRVKEAAVEVDRGASEIRQGNSNLSQRTEEQASSLEETASSMEEMTSTVKQNADNASQANQLALAARDQAEKGGAVVARAVHAMAGINESSKRIADIIGVIDEIAFQTNLLALNAAVEAARAGEQGRGFAVVATEVRNLAGRSATAAKEIKGLIQDSVKKVDEGSVLVTQSGNTLEQILSAVKKVTDIVAEIAAASREQSMGIEQVGKAIMQLDELTQQNAALVEEASAASQSMAEQARDLNEQMSQYKVAGSQGTAPGAGVPMRDGIGARAADAAAPERRSGQRPWSPRNGRSDVRGR